MAEPISEAVVRLYGKSGNGSWGRIFQGMVAGLRCNGVPSYAFEIADNVGDIDDALGEGADAPVAVCCGPIGTFTAMLARGNHRWRLGVVAANSTWLPSTLTKLDEFVTGYVGPSRWSCGVIESHVPGMPVYLWQHGVSAAFRARQIQPESVFSALHLSSSRGQRKGTTELTAAWHRCVEAGWLPPGARLHIILDGERAARCEERNGVVVTGRINASEEEMSVLYQRHHVVVQPSRAEGFGLVPLEALASGVPVVATSCTGHAEYVDAVRSAARDDLPRYSAVSPPGVVAVPTGELGPIDDGPGALAPSVDADAIAEALRLAYSDKDRLRREAAENARAIYLNWSWEATTRRFLEGFRRAVYRGSAGWT